MCVLCPPQHVKKTTSRRAQERNEREQRRSTRAHRKLSWLCLLCAWRFGTFPRGCLVFIAIATRFCVLVRSKSAHALLNKEGRKRGKGFLLFSSVFFLSFRGNFLAVPRSSRFARFPPSSQFSALSLSPLNLVVAAGSYYSESNLTRQSRP